MDARLRCLDKHWEGVGVIKVVVKIFTSLVIRARFVGLVHISSLICFVL